MLALGRIDRGYFRGVWLARSGVQGHIGTVADLEVIDVQLGNIGLNFEGISAHQSYDRHIGLCDFPHLHDPDG